MSEVLPITAASSQQFYLNAEGRELFFRLRWAPSVGRWYLSVSVNGDEITLSRQVTLGVRLVDDSRFPGDVFCLPRRQSFAEPRRNAWGNTHQLVRFTTTEMDDLAARAKELASDA